MMTRDSPVGGTHGYRAAGGAAELGGDGSGLRHRDPNAAASASAARTGGAAAAGVKKGGAATAAKVSE